EDVPPAAQPRPRGARQLKKAEDGGDTAANEARHDLIMATLGQVDGNKNYEDRERGESGTFIRTLTIPIHRTINSPSLAVLQSRDLAPRQAGSGQTSTQRAATSSNNRRGVTSTDVLSEPAAG